MTTTLWILIYIQVAMGAFDMIFHHEFTERLSWRPSQRHELALHGIRNLIYGVIFATLALLQLHGPLAWTLVALLAIEVLVTLKDFVEEDQTRKLPASERVLHTLLALNYGAILALLLPVLVSWTATEPAGLVWAQYGFWALPLALAAPAVTLFGVRDILAARRLARLPNAPARTLLDDRLARQHVLVTGATGFIGSRLIEALLAQGHAITVLTRDPEKAAALGSPLKIVTDLEQIDESEHIDAIINLAGQPVAGGLWSESYKARVRASRVETTAAIKALIDRLIYKPEVLINGSAIGIYGARQDDPVDEYQQLADDGSFSHALCRDWENEAAKVEWLGVRTVYLRIGLTLDTAGGPLGQMLFPFEFGLGGPFGKGDHWISWITRDDLVRLIGFCMAEPDLRGPLNAVAPNPVTNAVFAGCLGRALKRPAVLSVPATLLKTALGAMGREIFLGSQNVVPAKALRAGFVFRHATLDAALAGLLPFQREARHPMKEQKQPAA
ncbi:TIGR01777 family oxidoreductase [Maricaulis sp.]|uniref:TIGR01777 family oxidoreductase n=1 Tax=Maricaulis sp. TaxID=1486257 RepID=UPI00260500B9|nr:TIGR01777 family oxidoreductase [Maricaulis sp.]